MTHKDSQRVSQTMYAPPPQSKANGRVGSPGPAAGRNVGRHRLAGAAGDTGSPATAGTGEQCVSVAVCKCVGPGHLALRPNRTEQLISFHGKPIPGRTNDSTPSVQVQFCLNLPPCTTP